MNAAAPHYWPTLHSCRSREHSAVWQRWFDCSGLYMCATARNAALRRISDALPVVFCVVGVLSARYANAVDAGSALVIHGLLKRPQAEEILKAHGLETGIFLLRTKNDSTTVFSLCTNVRTETFDSLLTHSYTCSLCVVWEVILKHTPYGLFMLCQRNNFENARKSPNKATFLCLFLFLAAGRAGKVCTPCAGPHGERHAIFATCGKPPACAQHWFILVAVAE